MCIEKKLEKLFEVFCNAIEKYVKVARIREVSISREMQNSVENIKYFDGAVMNPRTKFKVELDIKTLEFATKLVFSLYPISYKDKFKGKLTVMLYDKNKHGLYIGDYIAYKNLSEEGEEIEFSNPLFVDMNDYENSLDKELGRIFWCLNGDLHEIVMGIKKIDFRILKKSWREGYE